MAKIKNWSKLSDSYIRTYMHITTKHAWSNDKNDQKVQVSKVSKPEKEWRVDIPLKGTEVAGDNAKYFYTKKDAMKYARKWMRNHPKGR